MKIQPLFDRVVLKSKKQNKSLESKIILPEQSVEKSNIAVVVAVGEGDQIDGKKQEMKVKKGNTVMYSKYAGSQFDLSKQTYIIIKQTDILAILSEEE